MKLFTGTDCVNCDTCKQIIKDKKILIDIIHIDPSTREGRDLQMEYRIMGVPALIVPEDNLGENWYVGMDAVDYLSNL